jgi:hypothetical protein
MASDTHANFRGHLPQLFLIRPKTTPAQHRRRVIPNTSQVIDGPPEWL